MRKTSLTKIDVGVALTREEMRKISGGDKQLCFQCACQNTQNEWGCITISGCEATGDATCFNDYRCTTVPCS
jgi:hypothetical protein